MNTSSKKEKEQKLFPKRIIEKTEIKANPNTRDKTLDIKPFFFRENPPVDEVKLRENIVRKVF